MPLLIERRLGKHDIVIFCEVVNAVGFCRIKEVGGRLFSFKGLECGVGIIPNRFRKGRKTSLGLEVGINEAFGERSAFGSIQ